MINETSTQNIVIVKQKKEKVKPFLGLTSRLMSCKMVSQFELQ